MSDFGMYGDVRAEIRDFLTSRRARLTPGVVGIPDHGLRRVAGLRREEVAMLAGVSTEYYTKLERGDAKGASPSVVQAIARALRLTGVEVEHLQRLLLASDPETRPARPGRRWLPAPRWSVWWTR